uniref:Uncharacterized protein n=1 Tax=Anguilla anguilla TaxID=7936 RepID=A0A0E9PFC0_ANGAN
MTLYLFSILACMTAVQNVLYNC